VQDCQAVAVDLSEGLNDILHSAVVPMVLHDINEEAVGGLLEFDNFNKLFEVLEEEGEGHDPDVDPSEPEEGGALENVFLDPDEGGFVAVEASGDGRLDRAEVEALDRRVFGEFGEEADIGADFEKGLEDFSLCGSEGCETSTDLKGAFVAVFAGENGAGVAVEHEENFANHYLLNQENFPLIKFEIKLKYVVIPL